VLATGITLCGDQELIDFASRYLIMMLISFETLFQTLYLTSFFAIALGWGIRRDYLVRDEATYITIGLGIVYLHQSAFFVTLEFKDMNMIIRVSFTKFIMYM
jgi:hypothetical protein